MALLAAISCVGACSLPAVGDDQSGLPPAIDVSRRIDEIFTAAWKGAGVEPAELADDAMFLRRASLDITGTIPTVSEVREFLNDPSPDKRAHVIEEMLSRPRHATHLSQVWRAVMLPRGTDANTGGVFENWLQEQFREHKRYDELVHELLTATGSLGQQDAEPVLYYYALQVKPEELASSATQIFLGVQIRCAQCHDHPFTDWKQDDFWGVAAFFAEVSPPGGVDQAGIPGSIDDVYNSEVRNPKTNEEVSPAYLDATEYVSEVGLTRRQQFADWVTSPENPYFAKATVNRVWGLLFGRGLVDPVDDLGVHNPPSQAEVLELLADDFIASGFDIDRTLQILAMTNVYGRSSVTSSAAAPAPELFAAMPVRSLSAEQVLECLLTATGRREPLEADLPAFREMRTAFLARLEAPTRRPTEFQGGIPQTLTMLNGELVAGLVDPQQGDLIAAVVDSPFFSDRERVETLFLATVGRYHTDEEWSLVQVHLGTPGSHQSREALGDILWALVNSSEFVLSR